MICDRLNLSCCTKPNPVRYDDRNPAAVQKAPEFAHFEAGALNLIPGQGGVRRIHDSDEQIMGIGRIECFQTFQQGQRVSNFEIVDVDLDPPAYMVNCLSQVTLRSFATRVSTVELG